MYVPDWESLAGALARLVESGQDRSEAMADLCGAIADKKIMFRAKVIGEGERPFARHHFEVPTPLRPEEFDWDNSRVGNLWVARIDGDRPPHSADRRWREISYVEVKRADVDQVLSAAVRQDGGGVATELGWSSNSPDAGVVAGVTLPLRKAPATEIRAALKQVYANARDDPPNIKKVGKPVQALLLAAGFEASQNAIMKIASEPMFSSFRRKQGQH